MSLMTGPLPSKNKESGSRHVDSQPPAATLGVLAISSVSFADNVRGTWSPPFSWPLIAAHAILTPDGRVLTYGTDGNGMQTGFFIYDVWDPLAGPSAVVT